MRRMSPAIARRWSALSMADLAPRSRKSFGVQTRMDLSRLMRSRMLRLRSRFGPRCGNVVCPMFVGISDRSFGLARPKNVYIFRTNPGYHKGSRDLKKAGLMADSQLRRVRFAGRARLLGQLALMSVASRRHSQEPGIGPKPRGWSSYAAHLDFADLLRLHRLLNLERHCLLDGDCPSLFENAFFAQEIIERRSDMSIRLAHLVISFILRFARA